MGVSDDDLERYRQADLRSKVQTAHPGENPMFHNDEDEARYYQTKLDSMGEPEPYRNEDDS